MNKKVIKTMLALVLVFLVGLYVLKIFFPEQFILSIEIEVLINIGNFIDGRIWLTKICSAVTTFIGLFFFECAVTRKWKLNWKEFVVIIITIVATRLLSLWDVDIANGISVIAMFIIPLINGAKLRELAVVYSIHYSSQLLSLKIRNLPIYLTHINSLIAICLTAECYLWLILFYFYYNYKKEGKSWENGCHLFTEKTLNENPRKSIKLIERLRNLRTKRKSMPKELRNQKRKHLLTKIKVTIRDFIIDELWVYIIIIGSILLCSWIFNRWIEGIMFCIAHVVIRRAFDKQFHFNVTAYCLILTLAIVWFAIPITLSITASLLSSIPIAFLVCFFGYIAQDRVDLTLEVKKLNKYVDELLTKIQHKDIYAMTESELYEHCRSCGLSEDDCKIAYFVVIERLKGKELYKTIGYSERQTIRKRREILNTIK